MATARELVHANGLHTVLPVGFTETVTSDGFVLDQGAGLRTPKRIIIMRSENEPTLASQGRQTLLNGTVAMYSIDEKTEGSGGTEYTLTAWQATKGGWIVMIEYLQTKDFNPHFATGYAVLGHAKVIEPM